MLAGTNIEARVAIAPSILGTLDQTDEQHLVVQARNGSAVAIEDLVERYETRVFRIAKNMVANHEDAEEVVQNAFVKAFENLAGFRGDSRFYTWLVRIVINEALMKVRGQRPREVSISMDDANDDNAIVPRQFEDWGPNPEERYSQEELRQILERTISELGPGNRTVFQLRDVEGLSTKETAEILSLSVTTVKSRLMRARLQLRNSLDAYFKLTKRTEYRGRLTHTYSQAVS